MSRRQHEHDLLDELTLINDEYVKGHLLLHYLHYTSYTGLTCGPVAWTDWSLESLQKPGRGRAPRPRARDGQKEVHSSSSFLPVFHLTVDATATRWWAVTEALLAASSTESPLSDGDESTSPRDLGWEGVPHPQRAHWLRRLEVRNSGTWNLELRNDGRNTTQPESRNHFAGPKPEPDSRHEKSTWRKESEVRLV